MERVLRKIILFAIQGPDHPWWLIPAIMLGGLLLMPLCTLASLSPFWPALILWPLPSLWIFMRVQEYRYLQWFARTWDAKTCPRCSYSLVGLEIDRCPECGLHPCEWIARLRRKTK